jgi:dual specificity tyrosine-phosphorylation-regulated kinase 2/3/4
MDCFPKTELTEIPPPHRENSSRLYHSGPSALTNANINDHESRQISGQVDNNVTTFYAFRENKSNVVGASQSGSAIIEKAGISGVGGSGLDDPFDFEQSMNLEDVHRGIIDSEQLNSFSNPVPTRKTSNGNMLSTRSTSHLVDRNKGQIQNIQMASSGAPPGSMLRRPSITKYSQPQNRDQQSMARRRQSGASNMSNSTLSSATYRKSMTTTIEPESSTRNQRRKTGVGSSSLNPPIPKYPSGGYSESSADGGVKVSLNPRMTKSKSLQPPARQSTYSGLNPTDPTDHFRSPVGFPPKPPKSPGFTRKLGTPNSAASRRISIIPHASGLAARTISPTDARRMKRISMLKTPPPMPDSAKNTPRGGSPSMIPRKSVTPSSQGTTPEPQRKSYNSGLSTASTCTSVRTSVGSLQPKMPSNLGGSRLPRPPQLERDDEDIPPVPPLPKNLASPSEPASGEASRAHSHESTPLSTFKSNSSLFGPRKSSLAPEHPNELTDPTETSKSAESDHALSSDSPIGRARSSNSSVLPPRKSCLSESYRELDTYGHDFSSDHPESEKSEQLEDPSATFDLESFEHTNSESIMQEQNLPKKEKTWAEKETRRRRGMTIGGMGLGGSSFHMLENKASASSLRNKKDLAPIRLPPLNLLPLSTPTIARVNALGSAASDSDEFMTPTKKGINTPATPMTASKASFFNRRERDDGGASVHERSMSSFNHSSSAAQDRTPSSLSLRAGSSASSGIPISTSSRMGRQTISPYIPNSVPSTVTKATGHELKEKELTGLARMRAKSRSRKSHDSLKNASAVDDSATDPLSTTSSIRRKLSLSWKKSSQGKNSHAATERAEEYSQGVGAKFDNMPPPRLPSSSNWTPGTAGTPSPSKAAHAPFQSRRKGSGGSGSLLGQHDRTRSNSWGTTNGPKKEKKQLEDKPPVIPSKQSTASSILSPMTKMLGSKGSLGQLRGGRDRDRASHSTDPNLDHDDLIAEEEMRKIAMKRKNMDQAAAQLDDLKRRAHPKERMAPQQMLRSGVLNIFEKGEIVDYKDIYFAGLSDAKKLVGDLKSSNLHNFGYDDERGDYTIIKGDHLAYRYEIVDILGKGSFGQVVRCIDHKTGGLVAIKIIRNKKRFHQQALVEVNILQKLKEWVSF